MCCSLTSYQEYNYKFFCHTHGYQHLKHAQVDIFYHKKFSVLWKFATFLISIYREFDSVTSKLLQNLLNRESKEIGAKRLGAKTYWRQNVSVKISQRQNVSVSKPQPRKSRRKNGLVPFF